MEIKTAILLFWKQLEENKTGQVEITLEDGRKIVLIVDEATQRPELRLISGED